MSKTKEELPSYYRCGICECFHPIAWNGDCRDDANRFSADELDAKYGLKWNEVEMPTWKD